MCDLIEDDNRNEWIRKQLLSIPEGSSILDAGAGQLRWKDSCRHLRYTSQDFGKFKGNGDSKGCGLKTESWDTDAIDIVSDITEIPVDNETFDCVLCSEVLEHVPHPESAIRELVRVIRPGGALIITAPFNSLTHFAPYHFCTGFNKWWYEMIMNENGMHIDEITANGNYFTYMKQEILRCDTLIREYEKGVPRLVKWGGRMMIRGMRKRFMSDESNDIGCFGYMVRAHKI